MSLTNELKLILSYKSKKGNKVITQCLCKKYHAKQDTQSGKKNYWKYNKWWKHASQNKFTT